MRLAYVTTLPKPKMQANLICESTPSVCPCNMHFAAVCATSITANHMAGNVITEQLSLSSRAAKRGHPKNPPRSATGCGML